MNIKKYFNVVIENMPIMSKMCFWEGMQLINMKPFNSKKLL